MLVYLKARIPFITLRTDERDRALELLRSLAAELGIPIFHHTLSQGTRDIVTSRTVSEDRSVAGALDYASQQILQRQRGAFFPDSILDPRGLDVMHALSWSALFFRGRYDITTSATVVYEFNRDFRADYVNLNTTFGVRMFWR